MISLDTEPEFQTGKNCRGGLDRLGDQRDHSREGLDGTFDRQERINIANVPATLGLDTSGASLAESPSGPLARRASAECSTMTRLSSN